MARRSVLDEWDGVTRIDLAPMIDCVFLLLIFFLVTTVFVEDPGVAILKPDASADQELERNCILVAITADDRVVYGGKEVGVSGVGARVRQLLNKDELPVIIQADARSGHGTFSAVWSEVKHAGAKRISLATRDE
jgi:biopolymer transport protein ExbD